MLPWVGLENEGLVLKSVSVAIDKNTKKLETNWENLLKELKNENFRIIISF